MSKEKQKKIAVVISSFSALLKEEIDKEKDIFLTPLQIFIDSENWLEGFYSNEEKYKIVEKFKNAKDFNTSLGPINLLEEQMSELSKKYDDVFYLPICSHLSSSHDAVLNLSKKFKNVHVFDNRFNGHTFLEVARSIKNMYENEGKTIEDLFDFLKWYNDRSIGYIIPYELKTFIKSGRLKGIKKTLMKSLKLSTMIEVGPVLKTVGIAKTKKNAASKIIERLDDFIKEWKMKIDDFVFTTIYTYEKTITNLFEEILQKKFKRKPDDSHEGSIVTMLHTGWGAGYIGANPKISLYTKK